MTRQALVVLKASPIAACSRRAPPLWPLSVALGTLGALDPGSGEGKEWLAPFASC